MTQFALAERAGLHRATIADLERGRRDNLCLATAFRICTVLGLPDISPLVGRPNPAHLGSGDGAISEPSKGPSSRQGGER